MRANELRDEAIKWLRERYPTAHIRAEMSLAPYGNALVDVAAILPDQIIGVEIKGEGDSVSRLNLQGMMYSRACRKVFLLPSPSLYSKAVEHCPPEWYMLHPPGSRAKDSRGRTLTTCSESGILYTSHSTKRGEGYGLSPSALAELVWTSEYSTFGGIIHPGFKPPRKKEAFRKTVVEQFPLPRIEHAVCQTLRNRKWFDSRTILPIEPVS